MKPRLMSCNTASFNFVSLSFKIQHSVVIALAAVRYRRSRYNNFDLFIIGSLHSRPTIIKGYIYSAFRHFLFIWKRKRLQKKNKLCPQKGKQALLKSKSFCAMLRKKRLKCGRIPARLFLACHQKSNTFKCKQFCCAKPMCAYLSVGYTRSTPATPRRST